MYSEYDLDALAREPLFYQTDIFLDFSLCFVNFCIARIDIGLAVTSFSYVHCNIILLVRVFFS